jgi:cyclopropane fatty-acyl-phospholipid synthase-like methyltransferase
MTQASTDAPRSGWLSDAERARYLDSAEQLLARSRGGAGGTDASQLRKFYATRLRDGDPEAVRAIHLPLRLPEQPTGTSPLDAQQRQVSETLTSVARTPGTVVELGCGTGHNIATLAPRHPDERFVGIDLVPEHLAAARAASAHSPNATFIAADFGRLPLRSAGAALVFSVEALIHAAELRTVLGEIHRCLAPGGELFAIEIFRCAGLDTSTPSRRRAATISERVLMLSSTLTSLTGWVGLARESGFALVSCSDLTEHVAEGLRRQARSCRQLLRTGAQMDDGWLWFVLNKVLCFDAMNGGTHRYAAVRLARR